MMTNLKLSIVNNTLADSEGGPITFGAAQLGEGGLEIPSETALTGQGDLLSKQSIDYIFHMLPKMRSGSSDIIEEDKYDIESSSEQMNTPAVPDHYNQGTENRKTTNKVDPYKRSVPLTPIEQSLKIETFSVEDQEFTQLSDHYGISMHIHCQ